MIRTEKAALAETLKGKFQKAQHAFVTEYRGMTVEKITKLRMSIRKGDGELVVIKNRIAKIAAKGTGFEGISDNFKGPIAVAFAYSDPVGVAKALKENLADDSPFKVNLGSLSGKTITSKDVITLAEMPDKNTLLAMLLGALKGPVQNLHTVLSAVPRDFAYGLQAVKEKKEKGN